MSSPPGAAVGTSRRRKKLLVASYAAQLVDGPQGKDLEDRARS
jgi:hypothetical protein